MLVSAIRKRRFAEAAWKNASKLSSHEPDVASIFAKARRAPSLPSGR